jgi:hypothetical protein
MWFLFEGEHLQGSGSFSRLERRVFGLSRGGGVVPGLKLATDELVDKVKGRCDDENDQDDGQVHVTAPAE